MRDEDDGARRMPRRFALSMAIAAAAMPGLAAAGTYPDQPVRYINLVPPGGATDIMSRAFCAKMSELAGQQFVVENRGGAGGTVGQAAIAMAPPDGYTVGLGSIASLAIAPSLYPSLPYDPAKSFTFVSAIWQVPNVLFCNLEFPARSLAEFIALLKAHPDRYTYASGGSGTTPHLGMEWLKQLAGVEVMHVPYRGGAPAMLDLLGGRVQVMFDNFPAAIAMIRQGKVRPLAVTGKRRAKLLPDVPRMNETFPEYEMTSWGSLVGPAGLPPPVIDRLSALTRSALDSEDLGRIFEDNGATPWWTTPEDLAGFRAQEERLYARLVKVSGARVD